MWSGAQRGSEVMKHWFISKPIFKHVSKWIEGKMLLVLSDVMFQESGFFLSLKTEGRETGF